MTDESFMTDIDILCKEHEDTIDNLRKEHEDTIDNLRKEHDKQMKDKDAQLAQLRTQIEQLQSR